jgi:hypothetical protein
MLHAEAEANRNLIWKFVNYREQKAEDGGRLTLISYVSRD